MGAPDQTPPAGLVSLLQSVGGQDVPGFRGVTTLYFDGQVSAMSPYVKPWKMRMRRTTAGWDGDPWYPERAAIPLDDGNGNDIVAMNPAHIIYESFTNRDWGGGVDRARLNDAKFRAAADTLAAEGFGLAMRWNRQGAVSDFIDTVLDHIGAVRRESRFDGLISIELIRDNYDPNTLPIFTEDTGLIGIDSDENAATDGAANEIIIKYTNPVDGEPGQWRERNLAAITSARQILSQTIEYPGLPTAALAGRVAVRELNNRGGHMKRFKVRLDRRGYQIQIGDVFRISSPRRGIQNMVVRAGRVEDGTIDLGTITITCVQDIFGLPTTAMAIAPPAGWVPPDRTPKPVSTRRLVEASWRDLAANLDPANLELIDPTAAYLGILAAQPSGLSSGYLPETRVGAGAWEAHEAESFASTGVLIAALAQTASTAPFQLTLGSNLDSLIPGEALLIDNEICRIKNWNPATGAGTLARGCVDTVPAPHDAGARVWRQDDAGFLPVAWTAGTTVQARELTQTSQGVLDPALAPVDSLPLVSRQSRPYPPGNFKINGSAYPATIAGALTVTWSHRDRRVQADQLIDTTAGDIGPEPGTTYRLRLYGQDGSLALTVLSLTGTSYTWTTEDADSTLAPGTLNTQVRVVLDAVRDEIYSLYIHEWTVTRD
ncbi:hypothetical protein FACS1894101_1540 [Betaproteobacteria bacterium]|nr:hypothetical protein FACS1894101_1540 [Betaproteobacteria bacterium]